jgi:hypothetical protein
MKKLIIMLLCTVTVCGMTSCLGDDDEINVTEESVTQAMSIMGGTYEGTMLYAPGLMIVPDTLKNMTWTIDSVITIHNFPQRIFAESFSKTADSKMVDAIRQLPSRDLKCHIGFYNISDGGYMLNIIPEPLEFKLPVGDEEKDCKIVFLNNNENSLGVFQKTQRNFMFKMNTYGFYLGENMVNSALFSPTYFTLVSTAKR